MTTLFAYDFSDYSANMLLEDIDSNWSRTKTAGLDVSSNGRLINGNYSSGYKQYQAGSIHWEVTVYGDDSTGGDTWYFLMGNPGSDNRGGVRVQVTPTQFVVTEGYTTKGTISDSWHAVGASRTLIMDWDPTAGTLDVAVYNGATEIDSITVTGITTDGNYLYFFTDYGDPTIKTISLVSMLATDGASSTPVNFNETFNITGGGAVSLSSRIGFAETLNDSGGGDADLSSRIGYADQLAASGGGDVALADRVGYTATLVISGGGDSELTARVGFRDGLAVTGGGAAELAAVVGYFEALAVSGGGSATIYIEGDTAVIREVIRLTGDRTLHTQLAGDRRLVISLTGNIGD